MSLISKMKHLLHPIQGEVWCLHRVVEERSQYPSNRELEITPDYLEGLILKYKGEGFEFVALDEIVKDSQRKFYGLMKHKRVNVSFDDGFRDVYDNAFPILKKYQVPFTIYLVGNFPQGTSDMWWIQLESVVSDINAFENTIKELYQSGQNMRDAMHSTTNTGVDVGLCENMALTWEQLKEMVDSGLCTIGSHSMTHPGLTRIPLEEASNELQESKQLIEEKLGVEVKHFSYPHSMNNDDIRLLLKSLGYESATLGYGGKIRVKDNPYALYRQYIVQS